MNEAYIVAGYRSAVGKAKKGGFRFYRPDDLAADVGRRPRGGRSRLPDGRPQ